MTDQINHIEAELLRARQMLEVGGLIDALELYESLLEGSRQLDFRYGIAEAIRGKGIYFDYLGDLSTALDLYSESLRLFEELGDPRFVAVALNNVALNHATVGNIATSIEYYYRGLDVLKHAPSDDAKTLETNSQILSNLSNQLFTMGRKDEGIAMALQAYDIVEKLGNTQRMGNYALNIGWMLSEMDRLEEALEKTKYILDTRTDLISDQTYVLAITNMVDFHLHLNDIESARPYHEQLQGITTEKKELKVGIIKGKQVFALAIGDLGEEQQLLVEGISFARSANLVHQESDFREALALNYEKHGLYDKALHEYREFDKLRTQLRGTHTLQQISATEHERRIQSERIANEAQRTLLHNMLPSVIADRLLSGERVIADEYDDVAILFLDIVSFTDLASNIPPGHVVHLLNAIFSTCDVVIRTHGLTKIKTIGDAYLAVAGAPTRSAHENIRAFNVDMATLAALDLKTRLDELRVDMPQELGDRSWINDIGEIRVRVGLHVGPIVAGVVGEERAAYDVWGDAVNIAARMEQTCEPNRVQVSDDFARAMPGAGRPEIDDEDRTILRTDRAVLILRGSIDVKGKGAVKTWWLV